MLQPCEQIELAAKLLNVTVDHVQEHCGFIALNKALYYSDSGKAMIVGTDGSVLFDDTVMGYSKLLYEFQQGKRTPLDVFCNA